MFTCRFKCYDNTEIKYHSCFKPCRVTVQTSAPDTGNLFTHFHYLVRMEACAPHVADQVFMMHQGRRCTSELFKTLPKICVKENTGINSVVS